MEQKSEIVLYQPEGSVSLEVRLENETGMADTTTDI